MAFSTITEEEQAAMGVTGLSDTPELDTAAMQAKFDELGNAAIDCIQKIVTELQAETAAASIGAAAPTGITVSTNTLQAILNAIAAVAKEAKDKEHSHANKEVIDALSEDQKSKYDALVTILGSITALDEATLISSKLSIPTSFAVATYVTAFDITEKILAKVFPVGSCYIGFTSPATFLTGSTWTEVTDTGISDSYTVWKRTA